MSDEEPVKTEEVKMGDTKSEEVEAKDVKPEDVESEEVKTEEVKPENVKTEDVKFKVEEKKIDTKDADGNRIYENGVLKTSRTVDHEDFKKNSKYDPSILPETDDAKEIRKQVEFYFSDSNLPTDKYMLELTGGALNLPVSIENLLKFGRMKRFKPASAIVAALRESKFLEVAGAKGQESVKRKVPFTEEDRPKAESRSVYVKGFGDEEPSSQFDIEAFFAPYGPTNAVRLRRTDEKLFKGSVFVEFENDEIAQKFLALEPKPLWKGKHELLITSKRDYNEKKLEEIRDGKVRPKETWVPRGGRGGRGGRGRGFRGDDRRDRDHRGGRDRGDRDPDDWKKRREDDRANGFKDRRDNRDRKGGRGRGGRRDDRGPRNTDRNREREDKKDVTTEDTPEKKPVVKEEPNDKKRPREDDDTEERQAKKVDAKSEVATES